MESRSSSSERSPSGAGHKFALADTRATANGSRLRSRAQGSSVARDHRPARPVPAVEAAKQGWVILSHHSASRVAPIVVLANPGA